MRNLTESLAAGVDPATVKAAINERVSLIEKLQSLADVDLPSKITPKELGALAAEVRNMAESASPDQKRSIIRRYIERMEAMPERRTIKVTMRLLNSICGHSLVGHATVRKNIL